MGRRAAAPQEARAASRGTSVTPTAENTGTRVLPSGYGSVLNRGDRVATRLSAVDVYPDDVPRAVGRLLYRRSQEVGEQLHVRQGIDWEPAQE